MNAVYPVALLLLVLLVRSHWFAYQVRRYSLLASYWVCVTKPGVLVAEQMTEVWPYRSVLWRLWSWDWRAFVVHQDLYDQMIEWTKEQLERDDLTVEAYIAAMTPVPSEQEKASQPPADPSSN